jgi:hypothetical protein
MDTTCILWTGYINESGYGQKTVGRKRYLAHRWAWIEENGEIPEGMTIDHLCRVRNCINVGHMEVVTPRENIMRGDTIAARNAAKTHCHKGHTLEDAYIKPSGGRDCRTCRKERRKPQSKEYQKAYYQANHSHIREQQKLYKQRTGD